MSEPETAFVLGGGLDHLISVADGREEQVRWLSDWWARGQKALQGA